MPSQLRAPSGNQAPGRREWHTAGGAEPQGRQRPVPAITNYLRYLETRGRESRDERAMLRVGPADESTTQQLLSCLSE